MARSKYIYVIKNDDQIDSCFTVKHEMEAYFDRTEYLNGKYKPVQIFRFSDGGDGEGVDITGEYFE